MKKYKTVLGLLGKRERWIKGLTAADKNGHGTFSVHDKEAAKFCLSGAIMKVYSVKKRSEIYPKVAFAIDKLFPLYGKRIILFNDSKKTKHKDVLKVLREAKV